MVAHTPAALLLYCVTPVTPVLGCWGECFPADCFRCLAVFGGTVLQVMHSKGRSGHPGREVVGPPTAVRSERLHPRGSQSCGPEGAAQRLASTQHKVRDAPLAAVAACWGASVIASAAAGGAGAAAPPTGQAPHAGTARAPRRAALHGQPVAGGQLCAHLTHSPARVHPLPPSLMMRRMRAWRAAQVVVHAAASAYASPPPPPVPPGTQRASGEPGGSGGLPDLPVGWAVLAVAISLGRGLDCLSDCLREESAAWREVVEQQRRALAPLKFMWPVRLGRRPAVGPVALITWWRASSRPN